MKRLFFILIALLSVSCSIDSVIEKNIEDYFYEEFPEYKIISSEFSRLYILHPLDDEKIPIPETDDFGEKLSHCMTVTGTETAITLIFNGCNRNVIDQIVEGDELFRKWETGAEDYVKVGFFRIEDEDKDLDKVGLCFRVDSLYNVVDMYLVSDYKYVYSKVFDKN